MDFEGIDQVALRHGSWEFPLSRTEKLERLIEVLLLEIEFLEAENSALRHSSSEDSSATDSLGDTSAVPTPRSPAADAESPIVPRIQPQVPIQQVSHTPRTQRRVLSLITPRGIAQIIPQAPHTEAIRAAAPHVEQTPLAMQLHRQLEYVGSASVHASGSAADVPSEPIQVLPAVAGHQSDRTMESAALAYNPARSSSLNWLYWEEGYAFPLRPRRRDEMRALPDRAL